jgi:hypothetical protein
LPPNVVVLEMTRKDIASGSLKYAAGATIGVALASLFLFDGGAEAQDMAIGALVALPISFVSFSAAFSLTSRTKDQD